MIAKTQSKLDQFSLKQNLKKFLYQRSTTTDEHERQKLDRQIKEIQEVMNTNKLMLPRPKKRLN